MHPAKQNCFNGIAVLDDVAPGGFDGLINICFCDQA